MLAVILIAVAAAIAAVLAYAATKPDTFTVSALAENGSVRMPIQETFWAHRFGMLTDQFGTPWMINCERPS